MRQRSESLRDHLVDVASRLFYQRGVRNVGIDEIIKESGVARMTLYNHFGSKDELMREYLGRASKSWLRVYRSKIEEAASDPTERLLAALSVLEEWFRDPDFRGCWITNATVEMANNDGPVKEAREEYHRELRALFVGLAKDAGAENAEGLAEQLLILQRGAITTALVESDPDAAERACRAAGFVVACHFPGPVQ